METVRSRTAYKVAVSLLFGLTGFIANFYPLDVLIPPNKASIVWGLVFPMLISLSWGWRYGLLSATLGLGAQTMWLLWLPKNGWAVFVAVPVYNLWILWHGWCAKNIKNGPLSNIYGADIPFRIFFAVIFATVFSWSFRFNPSPWAPEMTLTTAPPAFIQFVQFKVIIEGYMILLFADVLRSLSVFKKILLLEKSAESRSDVILSGALLFGLFFWIASGIADQMFDKAGSTLAESLILNISPVHLIQRLVVIAMCLVAGLITSHYFSKYKKGMLELERLNEYLTRYLFALDSVEDEAYLIAPDGRFEYVNRAACRKLGYSREELMGMSTPDVDPLYNQADWEEHFPELKKHGSLKFESLHRRKDGSTFPVEILANYFRYDEREYNMAFARDITERRKAEDTIRASEASLLKAQEIAHLGSWEWNIVSNALRWSDEIHRIFGLTPETFGGTYEAFLDCVHPDDRDFVRKSVNSAIEAGMPYSIDHRIVLPGSTERIVHEQAEVIRGRDGRALVMNGTVQDITERVLAAQQIKRSLREKEVLLSEIHHRVKNNMAVISSLLSLQLAQVEDAKHRAMFQECKGRIRSMALAHELLYKSRDFSNISVREYFDALASNARDAYVTGRDCAIGLDVMDIDIAIDELVPLGLILNELLTNSFRHGLKERKQLNISISLSRHREDRLALVVADDGPGLPEGFEINTSTGLGLRLVQTLATQLDGELRVEPRPARFTIIFPEKIEHASRG